MSEETGEKNIELIVPPILESSPTPSVLSTVVDNPDGVCEPTVLGKDRLMFLPTEEKCELNALAILKLVSRY